MRTRQPDPVASEARRVREHQEVMRMLVIHGARLSTMQEALQRIIDLFHAPAEEGSDG